MRRRRGSLFARRCDAVAGIFSDRLRIGEVWHSVSVSPPRLVLNCLHGILCRLIYAVGPMDDEAVIESLLRRFCRRRSAVAAGILRRSFGFWRKA
jgi:hypothetical protein